MRRFAFAIIVLLGQTVSCAPTNTPQIAFATATAQVVTPTVTATIVPTDTPTTTVTPLPTTTPLPTATPRPTSTSTPTTTPIPKELLYPPIGTLYFKSNFADADPKNFPPQTDKKRGADFSTGTFPGLGIGVMAWAVGDAPFEGAPHNGPVRRGYPTFYPGNFEGPHLVAMDVWIDPDIEPLPTRGCSTCPWLSILSVYGYTSEEPIISVATAVVNLYPRREVIPGSDGNFQATLFTVSRNGGTTRAQHLPNAPIFELGKVYRLQIAIFGDRHVALYQSTVTELPDEPRLVAFGTLSEDQVLGFRGGHGGIYSGNLKKVRIWNSRLEVYKLK